MTLADAASGNSAPARPGLPPSGSLDETPIDRAEQADLLAGAARIATTIRLEAPDDNGPSAADAPAPVGQSGDTTPVATSSGLFTERQSTGYGVTPNISVGSLGTGGYLGGGGIGDVSTSSSYSTQTVTLAGSGLVFVNTYTSNVSQSYKNAIISAENFYQSHLSNSVTLNFTFDTKNAGANGFVASNSFSTFHLSYASLKSALTSHATSADDAAAVASLPSSDVSGGKGFDIPGGLAEALGLVNAKGATTRRRWRATGASSASGPRSAS